MDKATEQQNNKRIAKNTLLLYFRMLLTMGVGLYTSRVILQTLGVEDFGIYNVVGGVVAMFSFLTASMSAATQRFISYNLGKGNLSDLRKIFSTSLLSHFLLALIIIIIAESFGLWLFYNKLQIPSYRMNAAFWTFQCSIVAAVIALVSVPYNAVIVAHEKMKAFAYISIIEALAKLAIAYSLTQAPIDKLIFYALLLAIVQIIIRFIYTAYCHKNFPESDFILVKDKRLFKEIFSFVGWTIFGQAGCMAAIHGESILLNMFFGPVVNAARGIANQVNFAINSFATNFQMAINPQITKTYASGNIQQHHSLIYASAKFSCLLLILLSIPILAETEFILTLWLKNVPDYTRSFVRIILITAIFDSTANAVAVSAQATGRIKYYQIACGLSLLLILPISYIFLKLGYNAKTVLFIHLAMTMLTQCVRISFLHHLINFDGIKMIRTVYAPCCAVFLCSLIPAYFITNLYQPSSLRFIANILSSLAFSSFLIIFLGMNKNERKSALNMIKKVRSKF